MEKLAVNPINEEEKGNNFEFTLNGLDNLIRALSLNSPLGKMALLGIPSYFIGKHYAPAITRILSPNLNSAHAQDSWSTMSPEEQHHTRKLLGLGLSTVVTLPTLLNNLSFNKEWWGLKQFEKKSSAMDPFPSMTQNMFNPPTVQANMALDSIANNSTLPMSVKETSMRILGSFAPQEHISNQDIINRAVSTGIDALKGGAVGFVTAKALGLPNPWVTAGIMAGINAII